MNGGQICEVFPNRGLRQGDPLSPYLFLIIADVFSMLTNKTMVNESLSSIKMKQNCPMVSHLLFSDDSLVFLEANAQSCSNFLHIVDAFSDASGLSINTQKSSLFFSVNASLGLKEEIKGILGMKEMNAKTQYLGLPAL